MTFRERVIDFVSDFSPPYIEVGCGDCWLIRNLRGYRIGVDPCKPTLPDHYQSSLMKFYQERFEMFMLEHQDEFASTKTVVMCYPPGPAPVHTVGEDVVMSMRPGQDLVLISPRPYECATVAGTVGMWYAIFRTMRLVGKKKIDDTHVGYWLRKRDDFELPEDTKAKILGQHTLWQLNGRLLDE